MSLGPWKEITNGTFQVGAKVFIFGEALPVEGSGMKSAQATRPRRLQRIQKPLVDGTQHKDFGADTVTHTAELVFFGDDYFEKYKAFKAIMNTGAEGILTLPHLDESVVAIAVSTNENSSSSEAHTINVTAIWEETIDDDLSNIIQQDRNKNPNTFDENKSALEKAVGFAASIVNDNPFLNGVRSFESGLSKVRQFVNAALTLESGVRNRIIAIQANITGTLRLIGQLTDVIAGVRGAPSASAVTTTLGLDPETGLQIGDVDQLDDIVAALDPLAEPVPDVDIGIDTRNVSTEAGQELVLTKISESLKSDRDQLNTDGAGKVQDINDALTDVINLITDIKASILTSQLRIFQIPQEMSFMEILHIAGRSVDEMRELHKQNTQITDLLIVPRDSVVFM